MARKVISQDNRTSLATDLETKVVFDWSMNESEQKSVTGHLRRLLMDKHKQEWDTLVGTAQNKMIVCKKHNRPVIMYCGDCDVSLCVNCDIKSHVDMGHDVQNYCRAHQVGYRGSCLLCEKERWTGIVDVPAITAEELFKQNEKGADLIVIDVRNDQEYDTGHLPKSYENFHMEFKYLSQPTDSRYKQFKDLIEKNPDACIIIMSQWSPKKRHKKETSPKGSARGYIGAAMIKITFKHDKVYYLDGGWSAFHKEYPEIVQKGHDPSKCGICQFYHHD